MESQDNHTLTASQIPCQFARMSLNNICKPLIQKIEGRAFLYPKSSDLYKKTSETRKKSNKEIRKAVKEMKESPDYWNYNKIEPMVRREVIDELDNLLPPWSKLTKSDGDTEEEIRKCANMLFHADALNDKLKWELADAVERLEKEMSERSRVLEGTVVDLWG